MSVIVSESRVETRPKGTAEKQETPKKSARNRKKTD